MKKIFFIFTTIIGLSFAACSPDEVTINDLEPSEPKLVGAELNAPDVTSFEIIQTTDVTDGNELNNAVSLNWEPASGDNDGDILYYVQMDVAGNDFESAVTIPLAQTGTTELIRDLTFGELNEAANQIAVNLTSVASSLSIKFDEENDLEVRVQTILGASIAVKYSQSIAIMVKPYFTGLSESISIDGEAVDSKVILSGSDGVFQGRAEFTNGTFRFFAEPSESNISYNYDYFESRGYTIDALLENAGDPEMNFNFTGTEGPWDISLNTVEKSITLTEVVAPDDLYLIGSLTGWDLATAWPFHNNGDNTFSLAVTLVDGDQFKFLPTNTTWDGAWKEDPNNPGNIINEAGDPNISGYPAGHSLITVDFNTLTFEIKPIPTLYLVGSTTGWDPGTSLPMSIASDGVFSIKQTFAAGDEFKFLPTNADWSGDFGEDPNNPGMGFDGEGEKNIIIETDGDYIISYDYTTNTINVSSIVIPAELYLVGSFRGWSNDADNPKFTETSAGIFEISQDLSIDDEFKFVKSNSGGDWANDMAVNKTHYGVIEQNDETNLKVSEAGTYTIIVNFNDGTISLSM